MELQLDNMTKLQLRSLCRAAKVRGFGKMTKEQMQKALAKVKGISVGALAQDGEAYFAAFGGDEKAPERDHTLLADIFPTAPMETAFKVPEAAPAEPVAVKTPRPEQNGVKAPLKGKCRDVWDWCDDWKQTTGSAPTAADARDHATKVGWNLSNTSIELSAWKRFHGLTRKEVKAA